MIVRDLLAGELTAGRHWLHLCGYGRASKSAIGGIRRLVSDVEVELLLLDISGDSAGLLVPHSIGGHHRVGVISHKLLTIVLY